jgi:EPS-associated MarR family transcriptional regulator
MASLQDARREEARLKVLRYIAEHPVASTRQIAEAVNVSNGAAFYVLRALVDKGLVKVENFARAERKSQYLYLLTSAGLVEKMRLTEKFLQIKREEYRALRAEVAALEDEVVRNDAQWRGYNF